VALTGSGLPHHLRGMTTDEPQAPALMDETQVDAMDEIVQEESAEPTPEPRKRGGIDFQSIRNLWMVIGALAVLLIISMLWNHNAAQVAVDANDPAIVGLREELNRQLADLNRQRVEANMPPLAGWGEDVGAITARLRKDTETLASLVEHYQQLVTEKDRALTEKNVELVRSEQVRESLTTELGRVQANAAGTGQLQAEVSDALARANRLADELAAARKQIEELTANPPSVDIEMIERRLDEVTRARDFYKQRAEELEALRKNRDESVGEAEEE